MPRADGAERAVVMADRRQSRSSQCIQTPLPFAPSCVWIDQDLCTGDGLCVDHCPDVFVQLEDVIAYVAENGGPLNDPGGSGSLANVAHATRAT